MPIKIVHKNTQHEDGVPAKTQLIIHTERGEVYQLMIEQTGKDKPILKTELRKKDLWIRNTEDDSVVIFKNYSDYCVEPKKGEANVTEPCYIVTDPSFAPEVIIAPSAHTDTILSANVLKVMGGVALLGGVAAAAGGGDGGGGSSPDTTPPTVIMTSNTTQLKSKEVALLQWTFSENVTGFTVDDIQVEHGTLINFTGSGAHYTATFVPHKYYNGSATLRVDSNAVFDTAGHANLDGAEANNSVTLTLDLVAPTIQIHTEKSQILTTEKPLIYFELSEAADDFDLSDIQVIGGTLSQFSGSGTQYSAVFTADGRTDVVSISVGSKAFTDAAGNENIDGVDANNQLSLDVLNNSISSHFANEGQEGVMLSLDAPEGSQWQLSGADAALFSMNAQGELRYVGATPIDFEHPSDANADGVFQLLATSTLNGATHTESISIRIQDRTELPDWLGSADNPTEYGTSNAGVQSLLSNDDAYSTWMDNQAVNPTTAPTLSYAFQNIGALFDTSAGNQAVADEYSEVAKTFIRSVFEYTSSITNLTFIETDDQTMNGADIRLFADTYEHLKIHGIGENTAAFAYQPYGQTYSQNYDYMGNLFLITDKLKLSDPARGAFLSDFGYEKYAVSHELAHALGLDHPFKDWGGTDDRIEGYYSYDSTSTNSQTDNRIGGTTGGGHDTPLTDTPMETLMTYHSPQRNLEYKLTNISTNRTAPWEFGIYDIAALQHLYGANTSSHAGDDIYVFDSNTPLYRSVWDGGGTDTLVQSGAQNAYINLNEGTLSRMGLLPTWEIHFAYTPEDNGKVIAVTVADTSTGVATIDPDGYGIRFKANINADEQSGFDGHLNLSVTMEKNGKVWTEDYPDMYDIVADSYFNVAIAFGVTIENAIGGSGNDTLIGNLAPNQLTGGAGNDILTGGAAGDVFVFEGVFGNDTITDFTHGQDCIQLSQAMKNAVTFSNNTLNVAGFGSIHLTGVDTLTAGVDYLFV